MTSPLIAVIGATGAQGGGLALALLNDPLRRFRVRALTRRPECEAARALAARGAEIVACDLDDEASLDAAFRDAHGVFAVTNYWEHFSPTREMLQATAIARAAKRQRVRHLIWSTLEDTRLRVPLRDHRMPSLMQHFKVPHMDAKGEADSIFFDAGVPTTLLRTSFYWENFIHSGLAPVRDAQGALCLTLPIGLARLPGIAVADIGLCALGVFERGHEFVGRTVGVSGEHLSGDDMARALSVALREPVKFESIEPAEFARLPFPGAAELANMFQFKRDFEVDYRAARPVALAVELNPGIKTFMQWLAVNAGRIPVTPRTSASSASSDLEGSRCLAA